MIVVGILSIILGIIVAIWTFIQSSTDIAKLSADTLVKIKEYVYVGLNQQISSAEEGSDTIKELTKFQDFSSNHEFVIEPIKNSIVGGLYAFAAFAIVAGIICVVLYFTWDSKRKNVVKATAVERFNEQKRMFVIGIVMFVVGLIGAIFSWLKVASYSYALQKEVSIWNKFVDRAISIDRAQASWKSWLNIDPVNAFADLNSGASQLPITLIDTVQIVSLILILVGAILFTSVVGYACKTKLFPVFNGLLLVIFTLIIIVPLYKTFIDSIDAKAGMGVYLLPQKFTARAYKDIISQVNLYRPFIISVITTLAGTLLGLTLSTLGAYVLIQFEMPGRDFFAMMLLFTMIFSGGMIPTFLVMKNLHLVNTLWSVILPLGMNVYNLVLMRNFFEGIPGSLFEAAKIDGCTPMQTFYKIVLPLSKAAIASIGLMFSVTFWNDYTNFKLYIVDSKLFNFQMKLRSMFDESGLPNSAYYADETLQSATVIVAILPFMIIYPFCQNYFVQGVNVGAVKE